VQPEGIIKSKMVQIIKYLMKIYTNKNTKEHKLNEYLLQLYIFSSDSKNLAPAPNKKKTDSTPTPTIFTGAHNWSLS